MKYYQVDKMPLCPFKTSEAHCVGDGCMAWVDDEQGGHCGRFRGSPSPQVQARIRRARAFDPTKDPNAIYPAAVD